MAKAHTPFPIQGKLGQYIFKVQNGQQHIQLAPTEFNPKKHGPAYFLNKDEFAGAAKIAHNIYKFIKPDKFHQHKPEKNVDKLGPIFRPYCQNYLTAQLKKNADLENKSRTKNGFWYASEFTFYDAVKAFQGLDLSKEEAPSNHVQMMPLGPQHNPTAIKVTGLELAARAIDKHGNAKLEFRFHIRQSCILELKYDKETRKWFNPASPSKPWDEKQKCYHSPPSGWIPVEIIPEEFTIPIPSNQWQEDDKYLTAIMIEWREIRTVGRRITRLHDQGIVKIAALHAPAEAWTDMRVLRPEPAQDAQGTLQIAPSIDPERDPKAYLEHALAMLHQPPHVIPPS